MTSFIELKTIDDLLSLVTGDPSVHLVRIHPEVATRLLEANEFNRSMNGRRVKFHATNIVEGRWQLLTDGIGVDVNGDLTNGQHRLKACVAADTPIDVALFFGLSPKAREVTDTGRARTVADTLGALGHGRGMTHVVAAARMVKWYNDGGNYGLRNDPVAHDVTIKYIRQIGVDLLKDLDQTSTRFAKNVPGGRRSSMTALQVIAIEAGVPMYIIDEFVETTTVGANLDENDPRLALRSVLTKNNSKHDSYWYLAVMIKAFNDWRAGVPRRLMKWNENEGFPTVTR